MRCLIIGCGCRGRGLAAELVARGHAVRGTTRDPGAVAEIEAVGAEGIVGDPDRLATLAGVLDHVGLVCVLLGSAAGSSDALRALHGPRLEMLLTRLLDTTVKGVLYEASGSVSPAVLESGAQQVRAVCERSRIRYSLLDADPADWRQWLESALSEIDRILNT